MGAEIDTFSVILEPRYARKERTYRVKLSILAIIDTSQSMFDRIETAYGFVFAYQYAIGAALFLVEEAIKRGYYIDGHLAFASDKDYDFTCGGGDSCYTLNQYLDMPDRPYVDYLSLRNSTLTTIYRAKTELRIKTTSGGTNPNPLIRFLASKYKYDLVVLVTDGYVVEPIEVPFREMYIFIVPGGTTPPVAGRAKIVRLQ